MSCGREPLEREPRRPVELYGADRELLREYRIFLQTGEVSDPLNVRGEGLEDCVRSCESPDCVQYDYTPDLKVFPTCSI